MEATFLFALKQPKQAVTAIERASQLAVFQDYVRSTLLARLDWATQHDNLTWEERSRIYMGSSYNYRLYEVNYRAVQEAVQARSRGDNQTAIRIAAALLRANKVMRRAAETYYTEGSARGRGEIVLSTLFNRPFSVRTYRVLASQSSEAALKKYKSDLLQDWVNFVRANGRRDVENRADWLQTPPLSQQTPYSQINPDFKFDASVIRESIAAGSPFFLFGAFLVCFSFALVWLTGKMLLFHRSDDAAPTRGEVTTCANFSFWSLVACGVLVGALFIAIQLPFYNQAIYPFFLYNTLYYIPPVQLFGIATVGLGCWLLPIAFASWKRQNRVYLVRPETEARALSRNFGRVRIVVWLLFFVFVTLVASNGRGIWDNTPLQVPVTGTVAFICLAIAVTMEAVRFRRTGQMLPRFTIERTFPEPTQRRAWRWARNGAWIIVVAGFYAALPRTLWYQPLRFSITGLSIGAIAILIAIALSFKTLHRDSFFLRLATQSAGVLSIVCSFTFLLLALGVWPLRIELNRQLDRQLSMNEIDWMKEQIAKNSRPSP
ncbi:hypothetical protein EON83_05425 [bacterium]|nr:MAG: hypothetical protein EON83_05425 [bacterium]